MSKADDTRARILDRAAALFNRRGYAGASIADVMAATGLKKGGIYNHFGSKDELVVAAFDHAVSQAKRLHMRSVKGSRNSITRLKAIVQSFTHNFEEISALGGCPLLNTAIESDDTHPVLRSRTQQAMDDWRYLVCRVVQKGIHAGEILPDVEPDEVATTLIAMLEGSLMLAKLYGDRLYLQRAEAHLETYIERLTMHT